MPERIGWLELVVAGITVIIVIGGIAWIVKTIINYRLWHRPRKGRKRK